MRDFASDANGLMAVGRYEDAIPLLEQAIRQNPEDFRARCLLAICLLNTEKAKAAADMARSAIALNPESEWPHQILSQALSALGRNSKALNEAQESARLRPDQARTQFRLAAAFLNKRWKLKQASAAVKRGLALDPDSIYGQELLGSIALKRRRWKEAEAAYRAALAKRPGEWVFMNNLAIALKKQRKTGEALVMFENAARANPRAKLAQRNLYLETRRYLGPGAAGLFFMFQIIRVLAGRYQGDTPMLVSVGFVFVVVGAAWFFYRRFRRAKLSPTTRTFYELEARRLRRQQMPYAAGLLIGGMAIVFVSLMTFPALQFWSLVLMVGGVLLWLFGWRWFWHKILLPTIEHRPL